MTTLADGEIVSTKRAFAVVTGGTTQPPSGRMMIERGGLRDLPPLQHAGPDLMTFLARGLFMLVVTEAHTKGLRELRRAGITAELVTSPTR